MGPAGKFDEVYEVVLAAFNVLTVLEVLDE